MLRVLELEQNYNMHALLKWHLIYVCEKLGGEISNNGKANFK